MVSSRDSWGRYMVLKEARRVESAVGAGGEYCCASECYEAGLQALFDERAAAGVCEGE